MPSIVSALLLALPSTEPVAGITQAADCVARRYPRQVDRAIEVRTVADMGAALRAIPTKGCPTLLIDDTQAIEQRGMLFAAMYRRHGPVAGRSASNIIIRWTPTLPTDDPRITWYQVSDCLVSKMPQATRQFVSAADASDEESQYLSRIMPSLPACLPANQYRIRRPILKAFLAETIYEIDFAVSAGDRRFVW